MSDEHYTDDDRLDARLRAGLAALVAEAPEPPTAAGAGASGGRALGRLLAVAAVVAVGLVVAAAVGGHPRARRHEHRHDATRRHRRSSGRRSCSSRRATAGERIDLPDAGRPWLRVDLRIDRRRVGSIGGCAGGLRSVRLHRGAVTFERRARVTFASRGPGMRTLGFSSDDRAPNRPRSGPIDQRSRAGPPRACERPASVRYRATS